MLWIALGYKFKNAIVEGLYQGFLSKWVVKLGSFQLSIENAMVRFAAQTLIQKQKQNGLNCKFSTKSWGSFDEPSALASVRWLR